MWIYVTRLSPFRLVKCRLAQLANKSNADFGLAELKPSPPYPTNRGNRLSFTEAKSHWTRRQPLFCKSLTSFILQKTLPNIFYGPQQPLHFCKKCYKVSCRPPHFYKLNPPYTWFAMINRMMEVRGSNHHNRHDECPNNLPSSSQNSARNQSER